MRAWFHNPKIMSGWCSSTSYKSCAFYVGCQDCGNSKPLLSNYSASVTGINYWVIWVENLRKNVLSLYSQSPSELSLAVPVISVRWFLVERGGQSHRKLSRLISSLYSATGSPPHLMWIQLSQVSRWKACWVFLTDFGQIPQIYFVLELISYKIIQNSDIKPTRLKIISNI